MLVHAVACCSLPTYVWWRPCDRSSRRRPRQLLSEAESHHTKINCQVGRPTGCRSYLYRTEHRSIYRAICMGICLSRRSQLPSMAPWVSWGVCPSTEHALGVSTAFATLSGHVPFIETSSVLCLLLLPHVHPSGPGPRPRRPRRYVRLRWRSI